MKKNKKKITILGLALMSLLSLNSLKTNAYEPSKDRNTEFLEMTKWNQAKWSSGYKIPLNLTSDNLATSGCGYFSLTNILIKSRNVKEGYRPNDLIKEVKAKRLQDSLWGHFHFQKVKKLGYDLEFVKQDFNTHNLNINKLQEYIKKNVYDKGYYAVICVENGLGGRHYVSLDYIDEKGDVRIYDSGFQGTWLKDYYTGKSAPYMMILKSSVDIRDTFSYYKDASAKKHNAAVQKKLDERKAKEEAEKLAKELEKIIEVDEVVGIEKVN